MSDSETLPWVALLMLMVHGPESGAELTLRGTIRSRDGSDPSRHYMGFVRYAAEPLPVFAGSGTAPPASDDPPPLRVWRDGRKVRIEEADGFPNLIADATTSWSFERRQDAPLESPRDAVQPGFRGTGLLFRRRASAFLGDDFTRPAGPVHATRFLGRPAWEVELAPPEHKPYPIQLVVDAETGIVLQQRNDAFRSVDEWTEFVVGEPLDAALFTWDGPVRLEADERAAAEAEHETDMARRRDWFSAHVAPLPMPLQLHVDVTVHEFDDTGAFLASLGEVGTLTRRPRADGAEDLRWSAGERGWSDDAWDWALNGSEETVSEEDLGLLRQYLTRTLPSGAAGRQVISDARPGFAFQHSAHDRRTEQRKDADFIAAAWADDRTRVVVVHGMSLATTSDGTRLATVPPSDAPSGQRMFLGEAEGVHYFLVIASDVPPHGTDGAAFSSLRSVATTLSDVHASLAVHAEALAQWHDRHRRCAVCGHETDVALAGESRHCPSCGAAHFPRTDPAVIMLVVDADDRCLLGHNAARDATSYSTLAGFVEPGETLEDAVVREVAEETGVGVDAVSYFGSQPWPFPSSLMVGFHAHASRTAIAVDGVEITKARWFTRDELRDEIEAGRLVVPSTISISGALLESWYGAPLPAGPATT